MFGETDQCAHHIIWLKENQIQQYQITRLDFGANFSPSGAIYVLNYYAKENSQQFPEALKAVRMHFYMDDYIQTQATPEDACKVVLEINYCPQAGGFRPTKSVSNSHLELNQIPPEDKETRQMLLEFLVLNGISRKTFL